MTVGDYERRKVAHAFGVTLQIMRRRQAVSQDRLSYRCGLDRTYPSLLERGLRQPTLSMLLRIADALGVEPQLLLDETLAQLRKEIPP
jgi:transcriptional regulator with XRE-family HTH domain